MMAIDFIKFVKNSKFFNENPNNKSSIKLNKLITLNIEKYFPIIYEWLVIYALLN